MKWLPGLCSCGRNCCFCSGFPASVFPPNGVLFKCICACPVRPHLVITQVISIIECTENRFDKQRGAEQSPVGIVPLNRNITCLPGPDKFEKCFAELAGYIAFEISIKIFCKSALSRSRYSILRPNPIKYFPSCWRGYSSVIISRLSDFLRLLKPDLRKPSFRHSVCLQLHLFVLRCVCVILRNSRQWKTNILPATAANFPFSARLLIEPALYRSRILATEM